MYLRITLNELLDRVQHSILLGGPGLGFSAPPESLVVEEFGRERPLVAPSLARGRDQTVT